MPNTVRVLALKDFPYSHDGRDTKTVAKDTEFDCRADVVDGLVKEQIVSKVGATKVAAASAGKADALKRAVEAADLAEAAEEEARGAAEALRTADDADRADAQAAFDKAQVDAKELRRLADEAAVAAKKKP
jgi:hypothetical protein